MIWRQVSAPRGSECRAWSWRGTDQKLGHVERVHPARCGRLARCSRGLSVGSKRYDMSWSDNIGACKLAFNFCKCLDFLLNLTERPRPTQANRGPCWASTGKTPPSSRDSATKKNRSLSPCLLLSLALHKCQVSLKSTSWTPGALDPRCRTTGLGREASPASPTSLTWPLNPGLFLSQSLEPMTATLYGKRDSAEVIK